MEHPDFSHASVAILMATYNGAAFLSEQLASIAAQTHRKWTLFVSDDGSTDATMALLRDFARQHPLTIVAGPKRGSAANFMALLARVDVDADYVAFCDQDDIWDADKLARSLAAVAQVPADMPALYCTRSRLIDAVGSDLGMSPLFTKPPCFTNALVQNIAGGNTMLWNRAAQLRLQALGLVDVLHHDWWVYQWISGIGGHVVYDPVASISYRQHGNNIYGTNNGWRAKAVRIRQLFDGKFREWNSCHYAVLGAYQQQLTEPNQMALSRVRIARVRWLLPRLVGLWRSGIHRQNLLGNLGLIVAALLKRL